MSKWKDWMMLFLYFSIIIGAMAIGSYCQWQKFKFYMGWQPWQQERQVDRESR